MVQLRSIVELEAVADEPRAWRVPERQLVVHQMLDGDRAIDDQDWSWERPRINWKGRGEPPSKPRMMVELTSGEVKQGQGLKWPNLVGLAALIGALTGVMAQCSQVQGKDDEIAALKTKIQDHEQQEADHEQRDAEREAWIASLSEKIVDEGICARNTDGLEQQIDDCLLTLQRRIATQAEGIRIDNALDALDEQWP